MKDAYYFSHDCNAKDDPKCALLIDQLGLEGYGIFWVLVEILRDQPNFKYPLKLIPSLARRFSTSIEKINAVIKSYDLFIIENDTFFFSESLNRRMGLYLEKKKKLSAAGKKGNIVRWKNSTLSPSDNEAIARRSPSHANAIASKAKKSKEKERKIKDTTLFESVDENFLNLIPPQDDIKRNWEGLQKQLTNYSGTVVDTNKIVQLSNFGQIGHPVWKLINEVQTSNGKIMHPIAFILSRLEK